MAMGSMNSVVGAWLLLMAFWPRLVQAALSVMPHHSDGIVMQLRSAILLDEKDLVGPIPPKKCSSLDDGPFCEAFGEFGHLRANREMPSRSEVEGGSSAFLASGDQHESAQFVVDGVLSHRMQTRNKEAFEWSLETYRTFSSHVSRVVSDSISGQGAVTLGSTTGRHSPASARSGAQCFRLAFNRLPFGRMVVSPYVPTDFSAGLPAALAASWEGLWEPAAHRGRVAGVEELPWATHLVLRTALGYIRFEQPVVLRRFLLSVLAGDMARANASVPRWGEGGLICGRLQQQQKWCVSLDQVAAAALEDHTDRSGVPDTGDVIYFEVGNSVHAVDEVAVIAAPADSLRLSLVEVVATQPSHPFHTEAPAQRKVVLLRRPASSKAAQVEPVLTMVSRDAVLWDLNEVLKHHMQLRPGGRKAAPKAPSSTRERPPVKPQALQGFQEMLQELKAGTLEAPRGVTLSRLKKEVVALVASTKEIQDEDVLRHSKIESLIQQRLQEKSLDALLALQAAWRRRPVVAGKIDAEAEEVTETKAVAATEVRKQPSPNRNLIPARRQAGPSAPVAKPKAKPGTRKLKKMMAGREADARRIEKLMSGAGGGMTASVHHGRPGSRPTTASLAKTLAEHLAPILGRAPGDDRSWTGPAALGDGGKEAAFPAEDDMEEEVMPAVEGEEWADAASKVLEKASMALEKKSEESRKKKEDMQSNGNNMAFEMNLEKGTVNFKVMKGDRLNMLQELSKHLTEKRKALKSKGSEEEPSSDGTDGATETEVSEESSSSTAMQEELMQKMTQLVEASNGGSTEGSEDGTNPDVKEVTKALHQNIQDAFKTHFGKQLEAMQGQGSDGEGKKDMKVQVHVMNMDNAGEIDTSQGGGLAQMLQTMLAEQGQHGEVQDAVTIDLMDGTAAEGLGASTGIDPSNIAEALKTMFGQQNLNLQGMERSDDDDGKNEESTSGISMDDDATLAL